MDYKYFAFISYQRSDEEWARWLHHQLEHYHLPTQLIASNPALPKELRPLFLDEAELAGGNLSEKIHQALLDSKHLIVLCSPRSAQSPWVNKEVQTFVELQRTDRIIPVIIDGAPYNDDETIECFTPALKALRETAEERLAINAKYGREMSSVKVVAELLGVRFDDLWSRYEREKEEERLRLQAQNNRLLAFQSLVWSSMATQLISEGNVLLAQKLAAEALPTNLKEPERPLVSEAEVALRQATEAEQCNSCYALLHHKDEIKSMVLSPDRGTLATLSNFRIHLWDTDTGALREVIDYPFTDSLLYGADGTLYGVSNGCVEVVDFIGGRPKKIFDSLGFYVNLIRFRPGTHTMYCVTYRGEVAIWNADQQCEVGERRVLWDYDEHITFTPNGRFIAYVSNIDNSRGITICRADNFELVDILPIKGTYIYSLSFSPDGSKVAWTSDIDNNIHIEDFNVEKGIFENPETTLLEGHAGHVSVGGFTPDSKYLISLSHDNTLRMWNLATKRYYQPRAIQLELLRSDHLLFINERRMVLNCGDRALRLWNYRPKRTMFGLSDEAFHAQCFSPDDRYFAYVLRFDDGHNELKLRDLQTRTSQTIHSEPKDSNSCQLLFSHDSNRLYCVRGGEVLLVYDLRTDQMKRYNLPQRLNIRIRMTLQPDNRHLIGATFEGTLLSYDLNDLSYRTISTGVKNIEDMAVDHNGKRVAISHTGWVSWFDLGSGQRVEDQRITYGQYDNNVPTIVCDTNHNQTAYNLFEDLYIDLENRKLLRFKADSDIASIAFSPDGKLVAVGCEKGEVAWYDLTTEQLVGQISLGDKAFVTFIPNSHKLAIVTYNEAIMRIFDLDTNNIQEFGEANSSFTEKILVSTSGRYIAVVGNSGCRVFDFPPLLQLITQTRTRFATRPFTKDEQRKYGVD